MMQIWFLSNGSYSERTATTHLARRFNPPPPYGKIPVEHWKSLHGSSLNCFTWMKIGGGREVTALSIQCEGGKRLQRTGKEREGGRGGKRRSGKSRGGLRWSLTVTGYMLPPSSSHLTARIGLSVRPSVGDKFASSSSNGKLCHISYHTFPLEKQRRTLLEPHSHCMYARTILQPWCIIFFHHHDHCCNQIATKFNNFYQISQLWPNLTILTKFHNFNLIQQFCSIV